MSGSNDRLALCYHTVSPTASTRLTVPSTVFRRQVTALLAQGYRGTTFQQLVTGSASGKTVAVTFDDGELSVVEHAFPILSDLGLPATVFVPVAAVGLPGVTTWQDLRVLASNGWEVGSHGVSHTRLPDLDQATLERELRESRASIEEELERPCTSIAYPYGAVDDRVRSAAAAAGYETGCTTAGMLSTADPLRWPRVGINGDDGFLVFRAKTSRTGRALRGTRLGRLLEIAGRATRTAESAAQSGLRQT